MYLFILKLMIIIEIKKQVIIWIWPWLLKKLELNFFFSLIFCSRKLRDKNDEYHNLSQFYTINLLITYEF